MVHNFANVSHDNIFVVSPHGGVGAAVAEILLDTMQIAPGRSSNVAFLLGEIGIRSLERANPYLTFAETRVMVQFRKQYHAMLTAWGKGAETHPTRTLVYENFNSSMNMIIVFPGWTMKDDRRTAGLFGPAKAGMTWELVPFRFVDLRPGLAELEQSARQALTRLP